MAKHKLLESPIAMALDDVDWVKCPDWGHENDEVWATHEGVLRLGEIEFKCYTLNTGERVFAADDIERFFGDGPRDAKGGDK
jgi:hypothetical protein